MCVPLPDPAALTGTQAKELERMKSALFNGRDVFLQGADGPIKVRVSQLKPRQFADWVDLLSDITVPLLVADGAEIKGPSANAILGGKREMPRLGQLISRLMDLAAPCIQGIDLLDDNTPHQWIPILLAEWLAESFGSEDKLRPWMAPVDQMINRLNPGSQSNFSERLWGFLSQLVTTNGMSGNATEYASSGNTPESQLSSNAKERFVQPT